MPHFGPAVIGEEAYRRAVAAEQATGGGHFGPLVTGAVVPNTTAEAPPPPPVIDVGGTVREVLKELATTGNVAGIWATESARPEGPRRSVLRALLAEGVKRGVAADLMDEISAAFTGEQVDED